MNSEYEATLDYLLDALDASTEVRELARALVHRAVAAELDDGWASQKLTVSAVFVAFRRAGNAHSLDGIAAITDLPPTAIARAHKRLTRELDIDLEPANPHEYVGRVVDSLGIDDRTEAAAHDIIEESVEAGLHSGVSPVGLAAGAVYLAAREQPVNDSLGQREVAEAAGVSVVTVRHRYAEQAKLMGFVNTTTIPPKRQQLLDGD
jgi:transcription initiation factor TFIIB